MKPYRIHSWELALLCSDWLAVSLLQLANYLDDLFRRFFILLPGQLSFSFLFTSMKSLSHFSCLFPIQLPSRFSSPQRNPSATLGYRPVFIRTIPSPRHCSKSEYSTTRIITFLLIQQRTCGSVQFEHKIANFFSF